MAADERIKTMSYLRASFSNDKALTLSQYVKDAHHKTPEVKDRTFLVDGQEIKACHVMSKVKKGTTIKRQYVHIAVSTPGEATSLVPKADDEKQADLKTFAPPEGNDFMDGDIMLFIQDNHVLFCSTGLRVAKAKEYLLHIFEATEQPDEAKAFQLINVADVDKIKMIRERGVKRLHLNAGLFTATTKHDDRVHRSAQHKLIKAVSDEFKALFAQDKELKEYGDSENLTAELVFKYDRRLLGGELGQRRIESLAEMVLAEEEDAGFKIVTYDDETISADTISLRKKVKVPKEGKTVDYLSVWSEMLRYINELHDKGLLEQ